MKASYRTWLEGQKYDPGTVESQIYRVTRVEEHHGDLDQHFTNDRLAGLIAILYYSTDDKRRGRPNPSKIPFDGDIKNNLASYRNAIERYRTFLLNSDDLDEPAAPDTSKILSDQVSENVGQSFGLERDMQASLRCALTQLEEGLVATDEGVERSVDSGFIDITARDSIGATVVIELKTGTAGQRAVAQILSYMGDVATEEENQKVRGILVAAEFDAKAKSAAKMVPNLMLRRYSVQFRFFET
jgi:hypothetical protein